MDGLLLDTEGFYTNVQQRIAQQYGKEFTWEIKSKMMGLKVWGVPPAQAYTRAWQASGRN
jgi:beta-phosphoglucomutase-like phosphatase (HAD superfamily)